MSSTRPQSRRPRLFTIPPHADFLATLARAMRAGVFSAAEEERAFPAYSGWRIFLPTRRAARALAVAMMREEAEGPAARLLPRILPLGDMDEDELMLAAAEEAFDAAAGGAGVVLPPAIPPLPRLFLLAEIMHEWAALPEADAWRLAAHIREHSGAAIRLARSLAELVDSFENEEVPLTDIERLLEDGPFAPERPEHREAAQHFLAFFARRYPARLAAQGLMGRAARRAALIRRHAERLAADPPDAPVIAAGSTGSLPATAELLSTIARLPTGAVVLPGLDVEMDEASWRALQPGHPQYGLKRLLERMGADRREVRVLDFAAPTAGTAARGADGDGAESPECRARRCRSILLREALRPVETTDAWRAQVERLRLELRDGAEGLYMLQAPNRRQEALGIAALMRETLETPGKTCMLITPDRALARAVRAELARWNVHVDDSAGRPVIDTPAGAFLKLLMEAALEDFPPVALAGLLAHPLACFRRRRGDCARAAADLELAVLRPVMRFDGLYALPDIAAMRGRTVLGEDGGRHEHPNVRHMGARRWQAVQSLAQDMADALAPLADAFDGPRRRPPQQLLQTLLKVAEDVTTPPGEVSSLLWRGEEGEVLANALSEVFAHIDAAPLLAPADFVAFLVSELAARPVRPHQPMHARLSILGLLEARMLTADRVILGGLNEGVWPETTRNDPWLNRTDREFLHLPVPERRIGLSAHDFAQAAAGREVWFTCAERIEQQPVEPSRWLVRLQALLRAAGYDALLQRQPWPLELAARLDVPEAGDVIRVQPPRPCPPVHLRPLDFSASRVKTLLRDPYAIFAERVLRLLPVESLTPAPTPRLFGTAVHAALEEFARRWPDALPQDAVNALIRLLERAHEEHIGNPAHLQQVRGRLRRMAEWFVGDCEEIWRDGLLRAHAEAGGGMTFEVAGVTARLSARADRIDALEDGALRIIDYKTGQLPAPSPDSGDYDPQMDLEAALAMHGAFAGQGDVRDVAELVLVKLSGGEPPGERRDWHAPGPRQKDRRDVATRARDALTGLKRLLQGYLDPAQPYLPLDHGRRERGGADYDHLNRWREWLPLLMGEEAKGR